MLAAAGDGAVRQLFSITPLLPRAELEAVQTLALTHDRHVLVGSRRAVWKLDHRGVPVWSLRLLAVQPRRRLPAAFTIITDAMEPAFLLLDRTSGVLHRFAEAAPVAAPSPLLLRAPAAATDPAAAAWTAGLHARLAAANRQAAASAWRLQYPVAAERLLAAARRHLTRWHAADPLATGVNEQRSGIERLSDTVAGALYGAPLFRIELEPPRYHPALREYYREHPFRLRLLPGADGAGRLDDTQPLPLELGVTGAAAVPVPLGALPLTVDLHPAAGHFATDLPRQASVWLRAAEENAGAIGMTRTDLAFEPRRCPPATAGSAAGTAGASTAAADSAATGPTGAADPDGAGTGSTGTAGVAWAAFVRWHLATGDPALALLDSVPLAARPLVDAVARMAEVVSPGPRCGIQPPARTLAALTGTPTDWALAIAALTARRGLPTALLVSGESTLVVVVEPTPRSGTVPEAASAEDGSRGQSERAAWYHAEPGTTRPVAGRA